MEKSSEVYKRNNKWAKTLPFNYPDTMLTSLLLQPSTITGCGRFDRNWVNIDNSEPPIPTESTWRHRWYETRRQMASERQIKWLPGLLTIKLIWQKNSLINRLAHQSIIPTDNWRLWRIYAEHSRLKSGSPLMRGLGIHMNIPVSDIKLTLGLRIGFIISQLTLFFETRLLFPVNPRTITGIPKMSLLL